MKKESQDIINEYLGVEPIAINSKLVSAQNRFRLYWTNIPNVTEPSDKGIVLSDILESGDTDREKSHCIYANYFKGGNLKSYFEKNRRQLVFTGGAWRGRYKVDGVRQDHKGSVAGKTQQILELRQDEKTNTLTTVQKDNVVVSTKPNQINPSKKASGKQPYMQDRVFHIDGKSHSLTASFADRTNVGNEDEVYWRKLSPVECERLQTVPDNYTNHVSNTQRYKMLGNGWTVNVIAHIFGGIK